MQGEKEELQGRYRTVHTELSSLQSSSSETERTISRLEKRNQSLVAEKAALEERVTSLVAEAREAGLLISQLERVGSSLREEGAELRERLIAVERDQERLERERTETETLITEEKLNSTSISSKISVLEKKERIYEERIVEYQAAEQRLRAEVSGSEAVIAGLREQILEDEGRIHQLETELSSVRTSAGEKDGQLERLETELRTVRTERTRLENLVTGLNLSKDTLEDRNRNLREEIKQLKVKII